MMMFVMAMTSALAVGGAFVARQMAAMVRLAEGGAELEPLAETAIVDAISAWDSAGRSLQPVGATAVLATHVLPAARSDVWATRLTETTYWLVSEAYGTARPRLSRRLGAVVRLTNGAPRLVSERAWSELP